MMKCGGRRSREQEIRVQHRKASSVRSPEDCGVSRTAGYQDFRELVISGLENWLIGGLVA